MSESLARAAYESAHPQPLPPMTAADARDYARMLWGDTGYICYQTGDTCPYQVSGVTANGGRQFGKSADGYREAFANAESAIELTPSDKQIADAALEVVD